MQTKILVSEDIPNLIECQFEGSLFKIFVFKILGWAKKLNFGPQWQPHVHLNFLFTQFIYLFINILYVKDCCIGRAKLRGKQVDLRASLA